MRFHHYRYDRGGRDGVREVDRNGPSKGINGVDVVFLAILCATAAAAVIVLAARG